MARLDVSNMYVHTPRTRFSHGQPTHVVCLVHGRRVVIMAEVVTRVELSRRLSFFVGRVGIRVELSRRSRFLLGRVVDVELSQGSKSLRNQTNEYV